MKSIQQAKLIRERPDILFTAFEHNIDEIEKVYDQICVPNDLVLILNPAFDYNSVNTGSMLSNSTLKVLKSWGKKKMYMSTMHFWS